MECWLPCLVVVIYCWTVSEILCVGKSRIEKRLDAIEHLVRGEVYLVHEDMQTDKAERRQLMKTLNETLEDFADRCLVTTANTNTDLAYGGLNASYLEQLTVENEQNGRYIAEISETLIHTKRGLTEEKKLRKKDAKKLFTQMTKLEQTQNDLSKAQLEMTINLNNITQTQNDIIENQFKIMKFQEELANQVSHITDKTNTVQNTSDALIARMELLEEKLQTQEDTLANLKTAQSQLSQSQTQLVQSDIVTKGLVNDVNNAVRDIKTDIATMKQELNPEHFCGREMNLYNCLQQHFIAVQRTVMSIMHSSQKTGIILVGGKGPHEGRAEVHHQGRYGTVCDDDWTSTEARVVCRSLGYKEGTVFKGPQHNFGPGTGDILLDDIRCTGNEDSLFNCKLTRSIGDHNCNHDEDVGVRCQL